MVTLNGNWTTNAGGSSYYTTTIGALGANYPNFSAGGGSGGVGGGYIPYGQFNGTSYPPPIWGILDLSLPDDALAEHVVEELNAKKVLNGGDNKEWPAIEAMVREWATLAESHGATLSMGSVIRVVDASSLKQYGMISTHDIRNYLYAAGTPMRNMKSYHVDLRMPDDVSKQLVHQGIEHILMDLFGYGVKSNLARIEFEIIRSGGFLLGVFGTDLLVYYPTRAQSVMSKLLGKKPVPDPYETTIGSTFQQYGTQSTTYTTISNSTPNIVLGGGGGGIVGYGGTGVTGGGAGGVVQITASGINTNANAGYAYSTQGVAT